MKRKDPEKLINSQETTLDLKTKQQFSKSLEYRGKIHEGVIKQIKTNQQKKKSDHNWQENYRSCIWRSKKIKTVRKKSLDNAQ